MQSYVPRSITEKIQSKLRTICHRYGELEVWTALHQASDNPSHNRDKIKPFVRPLRRSLFLSVKCIHNVNPYLFVILCSAALA